MCQFVPNFLSYVSVKYLNWLTVGKVTTILQRVNFFLLRQCTNVLTDISRQNWPYTFTSVLQWSKPCYMYDWEVITLALGYRTLPVFQLIGLQCWMIIAELFLLCATIAALSLNLKSWVQWVVTEWRPRRGDWGRQKYKLLIEAPGEVQTVPAPALSSYGMLPYM